MLGLELLLDRSTNLGWTISALVAVPSLKKNEPSSLSVWERIITDAVCRYVDHVIFVFSHLALFPDVFISYLKEKF